MSSNPASPPRAPGGPLAPIVSLFSSVWLGITLLTVLFVYCTIGSAGILYPTQSNIFTWDNWATFGVRTLPFFELTEYEWFEWWPFNLLMGLIAANIITVTLRRIRFNTLNLGVWMIHTGIIVLIVGSVIYFGTKVEGDVAVVRRQVAVTLPSGETGSLPVFPGNYLKLGEGADIYELYVADVNPRWPILSGDDAGKEVFSATILVRHRGQEFRRQLLAGYPEYTEDILATGNPEQPMGRAVKLLGRTLVDEDLQLGLDYDSAHWFYLAHWLQKSWALYVREVLPDGERTPWAQRPVEDLPIFNDYVSSLEEVWTEPGYEPIVRSLDVVGRAEDPADPLQDVDIDVTSYLRYGQVEERLVPGGRALNPAASVRLDDGVRPPFDFDLEAFDPALSAVDGGFLAMRWVDSVEQQQAVGQLREPTVTLSVPGTGVEVVETIRQVSANDPDLEWTPLGDTDYAYRVEFLVESSREIPEGFVSVELRTPEREFRRWVFERDSSRNVDVSPSDRGAEEEHDHSDPNHVHEDDPHGGRDLLPREFFPADTGIEITYAAGSRPAPVMLVAGPGDDDLGVVVNLMTEADGVYHPVVVGELFALGRENLTLAVTSYEPRNLSQVRPYVVPLPDRERDARVARAMVKVRFTHMGEDHEAWAHYHHVAPEDTNHILGRYRYQPTTIPLADGRTVEVILSRQRLPLPRAVVLDDFEVVEHVGGYTGSTNTIRNWTSMVRFDDGEGGWSEARPVSVNAPEEVGDLSFFQAEWDPPRASRFNEPASRGYNLTVLGVGSRHGVYVQLAGCTIAVIGMLYAFYVKPGLRRRRRLAALAAQQAPDHQAGERDPAPRAPAPGLAGVGSVSEAQS